jgi:hypothetical protein
MVLKHRGSGSVGESGAIQRSGQGCVERSRGLEDPNLSLSAPPVCGPFLQLRSSWRNSLDIRNGSRVGATKAVKRGRRSPDRQILAAKEVRLRRLQLFPKQFLHEGVWMKWQECPNCPFRCHPGEGRRLSRRYSGYGRLGVWSPPCRSLPRNLCNPPRLCRVRS